jgi:hypothetical protein
MGILKTKTAVALAVTICALLLAAVNGVHFAAAAAIIMLLGLGLALTHSKGDVHESVQKIGTTAGALAKRFRLLGILVGVCFVAAVTKQSGIEDLVFMYIAVRYFVPWKHISRSLGLDVASEQKVAK